MCACVCRRHDGKFQKRERERSKTQRGSNKVCSEHGKPCLAEFEGCEGGVGEKPYLMTKEIANLRQGIQASERFYLRY